jgi:alpha-beta hydrolase superfamily lysophospholipase
MTEHVDGRFTGAASGQIYWQGWVPAGDVAGVVVLVHGLAEHAGRYAHVGKHFAGAGYAMYAADHRGHGRSDGVKGNINRMSEVVTDLETMIRSVAQRHPDAPMFLYGHSMGGLITLAYLAGRPAELRGAVLSASAVDIAVGSPLERLAAPLLSAVAPNLGVLKLDATSMSRDPAVVRDYDADPLNYRGKTRVRTGAEILATVEKVKRDLGRVTLPLLVMHGSDDKVTSPTTSKLLADKVGSTDLTVKLYDGFYHELHNEPEKETVFADVLRWFKEHA